ncbi:hypothetical protein SGODD07_02016 [Streptococcus gordonii]|uniref:Uncharacterized protein n=1 Tax=Streptococcus gordonii TaxID=1302 RepID=A0A139MYF7_STRGN|nr:hypothetical protein SGODD07_02016 [Streptococcus gordonii]
MNELIFPLIVAVALGFVAGFIACVVYLISQDENEAPAKVKTKNFPPVYTQEEIELAHFLERKQAVNEAFLSAQADLLKEFRK